MLKKLMKMRIHKRLRGSSLITIGISAIASVLAVSVLLYMVGQYNHVLTYYAFPQGDIGHAMAALADMRSATRGAIGYEEQDKIDKLLNNPKLFKTPIVRNGKQATVGYSPDIWEKWE